MARAMSSKAGNNPSWQQSMLRIKDPKKSLAFYKEKLGMTLLDEYHFDKWNFSLYFLASLKPGESYSLTPGTSEAHKHLWSTDKVTLELTRKCLSISLPSSPPPPLSFAFSSKPRPTD